MQHRQKWKKSFVPFACASFQSSLSSSGQFSWHSNYRFLQPCCSVYISKIVIFCSLFSLPLKKGSFFILVACLFTSSTNVRHITKLFQDQGTMRDREIKDCLITSSSSYPSPAAGFVLFTLHVLDSVLALPHWHPWEGYSSSPILSSLGCKIRIA